ncbi:hypothetical protein T492DRAFT_207142 [Pavlovales sp. CCMP2436]|nr:hypothetical protein T492DRAFT_207142 [Pavlovales sp. CCMP2436]
MVSWRAKTSCVAADGRFAPSHCSRMTKACTASTTLVLYLIVLLGYDTVFIVGVDLIRPSHFWTHNLAYPPAIRNFAPTVSTPVRYNAMSMHSTRARNVHVFVGAFLNFNNMTAVNLSPISAELLQLPHVPVKQLVDRCATQAVELHTAALPLACCPQPRMTKRRHFVQITQTGFSELNNNRPLAKRKHRRPSRGLR